ncbi:hypothetical protein BTVI_126210 [Pitangus sulphuratus]|nr:hypothetical protein BTVI_126210 [Pitangus sulphuratus]
MVLYNSPSTSSAPSLPIRTKNLNKLNINKAKQNFLQRLQWDAALGIRENNRGGYQQDLGMTSLETQIPGRTVDVKEPIRYEYWGDRQDETVRLYHQWKVTGVSRRDSESAEVGNRAVQTAVCTVACATPNGNASWDTGWMPVLGKRLGCEVPVGHVLGACFALSFNITVNVGVALTLMLEFLDQDKQIGGKEGETGPYYGKGLEPLFKILLSYLVPQN